jgi:hypothetical protein
MKLPTLAAAAVAVLALLGVAGGAAAANANTWSDPAGDSGNAADLTGIVVANDDAGKLVFTLTYGNRPAGLTDNDQVQLWLDADESTTTGDEYGYDYVLVLDKNGSGVKRVTSSGVEDTPDSTFSSSADGTTFSINRSELGNTSKFTFYAVALTRADQSKDEAPDAADRVFVYSLAAPRPTSVLVTFSPKTPKAGATFFATVVLVKYDDGSSSIPVGHTIACKGTLNAKPIRARAKPLGCAWKLPKSAKGKRLSFRITVSNNGSTGTFGPWKFGVR